ncbi:MAG: IS3 family transposase [Sedimenticola sp.]
MCDALEVSTSGYYEWLRRPESRRSEENVRLIGKIKHYHHASRQIYGSPRIHEDLLASGECIGVNRVAHLMKSHGIQSKMARKFVVTTDSKNTMSPAPNRLKRCFSTDRKKIQLGYRIRHSYSPAKAGCTLQSYWTCFLVR